MRELTSMQAACWVGRRTSAALGGVAAHLYAEFDGHEIDVERLRRALERLCIFHLMLKLRVNEEGLQSIARAGESLLLEIDDFRHLSQRDVERCLLEKRQEWTHQKLDLSSGCAARFSVSQLPGDAFRLHVDTDMIAIDPPSFRILMDDLAGFYEAPEKAIPPAPSFFDWYDRERADPGLKAARERDRSWWRERLADIPPAPSLPFVELLAHEARSHRLAARFSPGERRALERLARERRITMANLMLGLFGMALGRQTGDRRFRLNVPMFWRPPLVEEVDRIVGDFSNVLILNVDLGQEANPAALCARIGAEMVDLLAHSAYPGVNLMRDLSRYHGGPQLAPIVFTAALDMPDGDLLSERVRRVFGAMNWVISQGPQVALDAQIASADGGILVNWDIRLDALPKQWVTAFFDDFVASVRDIATRPERFDKRIEPLAKTDMKPVWSTCMEKPLTSLQQAYLLGRSAELPLGGVAMQEFREYRGRMELELLRGRLAEMAHRHASLRTRIDAKKLAQSVSADPLLNLVETDLRAMSRDEALHHIEEQREAYAHALFDLENAPWNVTMFLLPDGEPEQDDLIVFVRFDALILDGRSIAALMVELFDGELSPVGEAENADTAAGLADRRKADADYWKAKLQTVEGLARLPWARPLDRIGAAHYERQSLTVAPETFNALSKAGAKQRLFKNSTVTALVLEVLSHWLDEGGLCVGIPVAPQTSGAFSNRSSFIAVNWPLEQDGFAERAATLQKDILEGLEHLSFSGVDIARLLYEANGSGPVLPVVVTNGLSWPVLTRDVPMRLHGGLTQTPQVAMDIRFSANAEGALVFDIDYAREAIEPAIVVDIMAALGRTVSAIADSGAFVVEARDVIDTGHYRLNGVESDFSCSRFLSRIAANIFDTDNAKIALISGDRHVSYAELGANVRRIMAGLKARGLSRGAVVAVCLHRSPEHTAVTLACAMSGLIWVPIDASSPSDRLHYLLENCRPSLVVTESNEGIGHPAARPEQLLAAEPLEDISLPLDELSSSAAPAYYLYTSGTTGKPKCVVLSNRSTSNVIGSTLAEWAVTERDVFISVTPLHHDMSVFDVFGALTAGATLVLPKAGEEKDAIRWNQLVAEHGVTLWCSVPAILEMLLSCCRGGGLNSLRLVAQGGDYIKPAVIAELRRLLPTARLISLGGPTETTIWSIWHEIDTGDVTMIPYGRPLPANSYFLLDERGEHCPSGVVGRIHTAGVNVALGYLEGGKLAQTDFVTIRDAEGKEVRAFRTGDRGRYRRDGVIVFDSRVNGYVKVRGVRVSLPDIENELINHPSVRHVLVVDYGEEKQGEAAIGALYVPVQGADLPASQLRDHARRHLPQSHVPTRFLQIDELPLSQNGKPDRCRARALLAASARERPDIRSAPSTAADAPQRNRVLDIYLNVLGQSYGGGIDAAVDFISIGLRPQHLKAISTRIREEFAVELSPAQLVRCRNAAEVERLLAAGNV